MGALLALGSALAYGLADFAGGLLARRASFAAVALIGQGTGLACAVVASAAVPAVVSLADVAWGGLSGVGTGMAMAFLYRGLSRGAMSVVVPVSAVGGLAIPVLAGTAFWGERPSASAAAGIVAAIPALWLVSGGQWENGPPGASADGLAASVGIGVQYLALARVSAAAGLWPVAAGRLTATLVVLPLLWLGAGRPRPSRRVALGAALTGGCATLALVSYLLAVQRGLLSVAVVLSSLYPVIPVLLGLIVLAERLGRRQLVGLVATGAAIALLTVG